MLTSAEGTTRRRGTPHQLCSVRDKVNGDQVHEVHQEDPHEHRQGQRCDDLVATMKMSLTLPFTNSTSISTKHCSLPGTPLVALTATTAEQPDKQNLARRKISWNRYSPSRTGPYLQVGRWWEIYP